MWKKFQKMIAKRLKILKNYGLKIANQIMIIMNMNGVNTVKNLSILYKINLNKNKMKKIINKKKITSKI